MQITNADRLDAPGNFRIVFRLIEERLTPKKAVHHTSSFSSLSEARLAMLRLVESRGYKASECLGARVLDVDAWPNTAAFISYSGEVYDREPPR